ncbi:Alpha-ketoglutarate-dependent dioxygenase alkB 7, mitochondrial [Tyrophagus putrescentiae]|nr:Alpha-ketoglutarate-dependent dioxygenase alkB 7, mitochondrial [Tyrophagus putrescentiae]
MNFQLFSRYIYKTIFHKSPGYQWGRFSSVPSKENAHKLPKNIKFFESASPVALEQVTSSMQIYLDFITETEEQKLLDEVEHVLKRIRYETSHWDDAIHNYRETEHLRWKPDNQKIIERVRQTAFASNAKHIKYVHILDIAKDGFIKPHVDSVRFCGDTISGISLLSDSVMRLALEQDKAVFVDILLNRRSLYIMRGDSRYKFTHEILDDKTSYFRGQHVPRDRRISVICRNEPPNEE